MVTKTLRIMRRLGGFRSLLRKVYSLYKKEGIDGLVEKYRSYNSTFVFTGSFDDLDVNKETILVVSHEASRTGAPILSLNIINELKIKYNVVTLLLGKGPLLLDFCDISDVVVGPYPVRDSVVDAEVIHKLKKRSDIKFAIVNSIESRHVLVNLHILGIPSVSLIHEFSSYTRPRGSIAHMIYWTGEVVFSAKVVRDNAVSDCPALERRKEVILHQGKSTALFANNLDPDFKEEERELILTSTRKSGKGDGPVVVLGAGTVQMRKGVDLFLLCAAKLNEMGIGENVHFVWAGDGYDPDSDVGYSVYLQDQVERAGLAKNVTFIKNVAQVELLYECTDILLLSSRLDPLPNVAIDVMKNKIPLVCFDKTTGIAEILHSNGLSDLCVANYLDIDDAAEKLYSLIKNENLRKDVGDKLFRLQSTVFDMDAYVKGVERIALQQSSLMAIEESEVNVIISSGEFDFNYSSVVGHDYNSKLNLVISYVRGWKSLCALRKPMPGFNPDVYRNHNNIENSVDPFAHFLANGKPSGQWLKSVISPRRICARNAPCANNSVALHIHVFYPDLFPRILQRLIVNVFLPDLLISVPSVEVKQYVEYYVRRTNGLNKVLITIVPNRGRDIGALLTGFGNIINNDYEIIGHIHTKKSLDIKDSTVADIWNDFLMENLVGGMNSMIDVIVEEFSKNNNLGLIYPSDPNVVDWGGNYDYATKLAEKMGIHKLESGGFDFPVGTMFWAKTDALKPLFSLEFDWDDYPEEPVPYDGTMLHAIERLIPFISTRAGYSEALTNVPGVTR